MGERSVVKNVLALGLLALGSAAAAADVAVYAGAFNVDKAGTTAELGLELRAPLNRWGLLGAGGVAGSGNGAAWIYGGLQRPIAVGGRWELVPGFAVALYDEGSDGKDLGGAVEFRSSLELAVSTRRGIRLGIQIHHLSNAGIYDLNPGSNSVLAVVRVPLGRH